MKIISGGQTGADRAALDFAMERGIPHGGFCPKRRKAEDGVIDSRYNMEEVDGGYEQRTLQNVLAADATLIFYNAVLSGGTRKTLDFCIQYSRPYQLIDISICTPEQAANDMTRFLDDDLIKVLNIAGPRLSRFPAIYDYVMQTLRLYFTQHPSA